MYKTSGRLDEALINEQKNYLMNPSRKLLIYVAMLIALVVGVLFLVISNDWLLFGICMTGCLIFFIEGRISMKNAVKINLQRMEELTGHPYIDYETSFEEDGIHVHNVSTDANVIVRYADLVIFSETSHIYMMMTKGWQMIPIFKDKLEAGEDVKGFLQDQDTGIKW